MAAVQEIPPPESSRERHLWPVPVALLLLGLGVILLWRFTTPRAPAYNWRPLKPPSGPLNLDSVVGMPDGFAMLSGITDEGVLLWSTRNTADWESWKPEGAPTQLALVGDSLAVYGIQGGSLVTRVEAGWSKSPRFSFPAEARSRQDSGRPSVAGNESGMLIVGLQGDIWWTREGLEYETVITDPEWGPGIEQPFDPRCNPPRRSSPDVPPIVATPSGFVSLVSSDPTEPFGIWPSCEPEVWLSVDGTTWDTTDWTFAGGAYVYDLDWRAGRYIAVGGLAPGRPMAWTSEDGLAWDELPTLTGALGANLFRVEAGGAGWVVLGTDELSRDLIGWTSLDGECWEQLPTSVRGGDAAVSGDQLMVFDRSGGPSIWIGEPSGHSGVCG